MLYVARVARVGDHVRWVVEAAAKRAHDVAIRASVGMQGTLVGVAAADLLQSRRRLDAGRGQVDVPQAYGALDLGRLEPEVLARTQTDLLYLLVRGLLVLEAPAPELSFPPRDGRTLRGYP